MGRRKDSENHIRKITRTGGKIGSLGITIPVAIVRKLGLRERQKVIVKLRGKTITIKDWKPSR